LKSNTLNLVALIPALTKSAKPTMFVTQTRAMAPEGRSGEEDGEDGQDRGRQVAVPHLVAALLGRR